MISLDRIKIDLLGQLILFFAIGILYFFSEGFKWGIGFSMFLMLWQIASATHLYLAYQYHLKLNFLKTAFVLLISLPVWWHLLGNFAWMPVAGWMLWYFVQTYKEYRIIERRPSSFWDL